MVIGSVDSGCCELFGKDMVCIVYNMEWSKGQAGWALGGFARSVLVMGEWSVSQWVPRAFRNIWFA